MVRALGILSVVLKLIPLGIYVRAAACKFEIPILGCDEPRCPDLFHERDGCSPTGNTLELKHWCEAAWTPWLNGLLAGRADFMVACNAATAFQLMKALGALELFGWLLLWVSPQLGALTLTLYMGFGLHMHMTFLKDSASALGLQFTLFLSSLFVLVMESILAETADSGAPPPPPAAVKKAVNKKD